MPTQAREVSVDTPFEAARAVLFRVTPGLREFVLDMNKAAIVAVHRAGLVHDRQARDLAAAIAQVGAERDSNEWPDYLDFERKVEAIAGPDASLMHLGRSRQDMFSATCSHLARAAVLDVLSALDDLRAPVLGLAAEHATTIVPAYTHGVQAQPTTFGHYMLGVEQAFGRSTTRLVVGYARVNRSPLGAGAVTTSRFPIDRELVARLLGFSGISENSYAANHIVPTDVTLEVASAFAIVATQITQFVQDLHVTFASPRPWLTIADPALMGISSMMPQKRNPTALETLRELAAVVIGKSNSLQHAGHNLHTGMPDLRENSLTALAGDETTILVNLFRDVVSALRIDGDLAREECLADYSTMTEIADLLYVEAGVPFSVGHRFASHLAEYGRNSGLRPSDIDYSRAARVYSDVVGADFPLSGQQYASALDPAAFVATRVGRGGPQHDEIRRMLAEQSEERSTDSERVRGLRVDLVAAHDLLEREFGTLVAA